MFTKYITNHILQDLREGKIEKGEARDLIAGLASRSFAERESGSAHPGSDGERSGMPSGEKPEEEMPEIRSPSRMRNDPAAPPLDPEGKMSGEGAEDRFLKDLLTEMSRILELPGTGMDPAKKFADYGFHSLTLTELASRIEKAYSIQLEPPLFYEYRTPGELARFVSERESGALRSHYGLVGGAKRAEAIPSNGEPKDRDGSKGTVAPKGSDFSSLPRSSSGARTLYRSGEYGSVDEVAIVGMGGYFPGSEDLEEFWRHLEANRTLIREVPEDRWDWRSIYGDPHTDPEKTRAKWGGFLDGVDRFDPSFFHISPREAELMDPQHRLFLQAVWHAIEDSGTDPEDLAGTRTGIYVGAGAFDYLEWVQKAGEGLHPRSVTGNIISFLPNRISYLLDLRGPSEPIQTACSASLVAIHHAVESIRRGESEMAVAGGVHLTLTPSGALAFGRSGMLSEDGTCRTFDADASGYVRGEGVGALFLKPLGAALRDKNPIYALVKG